MEQWVPISNIYKIEEKVKKLTKLAKKLNLPNPIFIITNEKRFENYTLEYIQEGDRDYEKITVEEVLINFEAINYALEGDWKLQASIDLETNIVIGEIPQSLVKQTNHCDHCKTNRNRKKVIIVKSKDGEYKVIGSNCAKEFLGVDGEALITYAGLLKTVFFLDFKEIGQDNRGENWDLKEVIEISIKIIDNYGYYNSKSTEACPTKDELISVLNSNKFDFQKNLKVEDVLKFWLEKEIESSFDQNIKTIIEAGYCNSKTIGFVAYMYEGYRRSLVKKAISQDFEYVGMVGEKITVSVKLVKVSSYETQYGVKHIHTFVSDNGMFVWNTDQDHSKSFESGLIKGTVKEHSEYNGKKQTKLLRVKF